MYILKMRYYEARNLKHFISDVSVSGPNEIKSKIYAFMHKPQVRRSQL